MAFPFNDDTPIAHLPADDAFDEAEEGLPSTPPAAPPTPPPMAVAPVVQSAGALATIPYQTAERVLLTVLYSCQTPPKSFFAELAAMREQTEQVLVTVGPGGGETYKELRLLNIPPWFSPETTDVGRWAFVLNRLVNPLADPGHWLLLLKPGETLTPEQLADLRDVLKRQPMTIGALPIPVEDIAEWGDPDKPHDLADAPTQWLHNRLIRLCTLRQATVFCEQALRVDLLAATPTIPEVWPDPRPTQLVTRKFTSRAFMQQYLSTEAETMAAEALGQLPVTHANANHRMAALQKLLHQARQQTLGVHGLSGKLAQWLPGRPRAWRDLYELRLTHLSLTLHDLLGL